LATKLRNIPYNIFAKFFGLAILVLAILVIIDYQYLSNLNNEFFYKDSYYETDEFQQNYVRLSHNVVEKELDLIDEETIERTRSGSDQSVSLSRLITINDNLRRAPSFIYVIVNSQSNEVISNIAPTTIIDSDFNSLENYIRSFKTVIQWDSTGLYFPVASLMEDQPLVYRHYNDYSEFTESNVTAADVVYRLRSGEWTFYTAVDFDKMENDILFGNGYYDFKTYKEQINSQFPLLVICVIALFFSVIYLALVIGKKGPDQEVRLFFYDYLPIELQLLILLMSLYPMLDYRATAYYSTDLISLRTQLAMAAAPFTIAGSAVFLSLIRLVKTKYIYKNPLVFKTWWWIKRLFTLTFVNPLNKLKIFGIIASYILFSLFLFLIASVTASYLIEIALFSIFFVMQILVGIYLLAIISDLSKLIEATDHRANGETDYPINEEEYKIAFNGFAKDLNRLQNGLQLALAEAIKGEKMKTELITNVSHDLKNPLTSIITYIDLLDKSLILYHRQSTSDEDKKEYQQNMKEYIKILNNKSYRLKTLIEDLVSASKASSGNLEVELKTINIRQMIIQLLAEREEYFAREDLDVVLTPSQESPVWSLVDPNHMYRVFENLISNILKYTMKKTRVFVDVRSLDQEVRVIFKNISNHPLDNEAVDLSARFVRGDQSRSTEGSGLGLSIVESLLKLQKGKQEISVDGDLFKVTIIIPLGENPLKLLDKEIEAAEQTQE